MNMRIGGFARRTYHTSLVFTCIALSLASKPAFAQPQGQEIRWLRVGSLHSWYSNVGSEVETGRTGSANEQNDGLRWLAQFRWQNHEAAKSMWIGTINYYDRVLQSTVPHKVIAVGPRTADPINEIMPVSFKMYGRDYAPTVVVDGITATDNSVDDVVDETVDTLKADRMIVSVMNTYLGITVTRRILAFSQQFNDNYFIYEYIFKNTGMIDNKGTIDAKRLDSVIFHFQYRYALGNEAFKSNWAPSNHIDWGRNAVNQVIGQDPNAPNFEMRAQYSWYGRDSQSKIIDDFGLPYDLGDGHLAAAQYVGTVTVHADKSATDKSDDPYQPRTTQFLGNDTGPQSNDQFNPTQMTRKYLAMNAGHPAQTHAELVEALPGKYGDTYGADAGGYAQGQGFGPYTLNPGDSIRIVLAEAVGGLSREMEYEIGRRWKENAPPYTLPNGTTTAEPDVYKDAWVNTCEDSIKQTFRRAIQNYKSGFAIPLPPPPPSLFEVNSGGNRVRLTWANNAASYPNFDGYEIYRAIDKPDTFYTKIFSCSAANVVHTFDDTTARRGFDYYYYIVSKDDGTKSGGVPLVSSKFYTMTNEPAHLLRPPGIQLSDIRVVPNPFDISLRSQQFGTTATPDRIAFYGLPGVCTIKIYTERGDLITTIEHSNGSGDEYWDSTTMFRQIVVSGVYLAVFQTPEGSSAIRKFIVIR
ncbi:MAG: hypothetical protein HYR76_03250 [Ignavibacteria bacterium]|nr:hypothetical protein [Ignavibacteria bacterium]MBI3765500.1 hypothetical protein [Ignavibacteriales bacterium]